MTISGYSRVDTIEAGVTALEGIIGADLDNLAADELAYVSRKFRATNERELIGEVPVDRRPAAFPFAIPGGNRIGERSARFRNLTSGNLGYLTELSWRVLIVASYGRDPETMPDEIAEPLIKAVLDAVLGSDTLNGRGGSPVAIATTPVNEEDSYRQYDKALLVNVDFVSAFSWRRV